MKKIVVTTNVGISPDYVVEIDGQDFIGTQISPVQFAILAIFYQYGDDGIVDDELLMVVEELSQQCPVRGLIFNKDDILPICSQLTIKDLLIRGANGFVITNDGKDYFDSFFITGDFIKKGIPRQQIIYVQSENNNLPKKI